VTFDDVTSSENVPLGRILRNFWLRMRAPTLPRELLRGHVTFDDVTSTGSHATSGHAQRYIFYYYYSKCGNRLRMRTRSLPVTWLPVTSLPVAPPQMRLWLCWYTTNGYRAFGPVKVQGHLV